MPALPDSLLPLTALPPPVLIAALVAQHPGRVALLSSFGTEAAVLLHMVSIVDRALPVLFLDTDRHFPETLAHRDALARRLGLTGLRDLRPDPAEAAREDPEGVLWALDPDGCCALRKLRPLDRALADFDVLLDGQKRHHGQARTLLPAIRREAGRLRVSPLAGWDAAAIADYRQRHDLPAHPLAAAGYASVGCGPCTGPTRAGETPRAGRWRGLEKTECGLHRPTGTPRAA